MNLKQYDYSHFRTVLPKNQPVLTDRALTRGEVCSKTGLSKSTVYRLIKQGDFPAPRMFGNRSPRWLESAIDEWMMSKEGE